LKVRSGDRDDVETHVRKAITAELGGQSRIGARVVRQQIQLRGHAGHGVDLTAQLRNEEAVHDTGRGEAEMDGYARRNRQSIDAGDSLLWVDEDPSPIH